MAFLLREGRDERASITRECPAVNGAAGEQREWEEPTASHGVDLMAQPTRIGSNACAAVLPCL